jgi:hypothetical protein
MADKKPDAADRVQEQVDREEEQGFRGVKVDPTPNAHYTVEGVLAGKPTPETDPRQARKALGEVGKRRFEGS